MKQKTYRVRLHIFLNLYFNPNRIPRKFRQIVRHYPLRIIGIYSHFDCRTSLGASGLDSSNIFTSLSGARLLTGKCTNLFDLSNTAPSGMQGMSGKSVKRISSIFIWPQGPESSSTISMKAISPTFFETSMHLDYNRSLLFPVIRPSSVPLLDTILKYKRCGFMPPPAKTLIYLRSILNGALTSLPRGTSPP